MLSKVKLNKNIKIMENNGTINPQKRTSTTSNSSKPRCCLLIVFQLSCQKDNCQRLQFRDNDNHSNLGYVCLHQFEPIKRKQTFRWP